MELKPGVRPAGTAAEVATGHFAVVFMGLLLYGRVRSDQNGELYCHGVRWG